MKKLHTVFVLFALVGCSAQYTEQSDFLLSVNDGTEIMVQAEIADDPLERKQGLMFRKFLAEDAGMLFVFDIEDTRSFWMKNTLIPLDILYFDSDGILVSALSMEPCTADPCKSYPSNAAAKYALEVNKGFITRHNLSVGDVKLTPLL